MPIYEYRCDRCGHQFDTIQKMSAEPLVKCPACGEDALRKLLSAPSFQLKGTGWYETDFKTKKSAASSSGEGDSSESSSSNESGGESSSSDSATSDSSTNKPSDSSSSSSSSASSSAAAD